MTKARLLAAVGIVAVVGGVSLTGQQVPTPTFKTDVNAVVVDFRVVDAQGRFVGDLTKEDLQIFEDGKPQAITTFDRVNIPIHPDERPLFADRPVDADVASNADAAGRLYVIVLDDLHTNALRAVTVRAIARQFIEQHFSEEDRAVIVTATGGTRGVQEFTNNRQRLLETVDRFQGGKSLDRCGIDPMTLENTKDCFVLDDRSSDELLAAIATWLAGVNGRRKAILFISEGFSAPFDAVGSGSAFGDDDGTGGSNARSTQNASETAIGGDLREVIALAARANVSIYPVDPRGNPGVPGTSGIKPVPRLSTKVLPPGAPPDEPDVDARAVESRLMLQGLAEATGGAALTLSNDFDSLFTRMVSDTSSYYLLGYMPTNDKHDGTFRKLEVRTVRPGLKVQSRTGYTARNDAPQKRSPGVALPPALTEMMSSPIQISGLTMRVAAPSFRGTGSKASVEVIVDVAGHDLMATSDTAGGKGSLELLVAMADADGHIKAAEHGSLDMKLSAATRTVVAEQGLRVMSRLDVAPGRYLLRIAGVDGGGNTRGSVQYDLDVPDLSKGPITMSGLAIASASEPRRPTTGSDKAWRQRFPEAPTASRVFSQAEEISVSGEIYSNEKSGAVETTTTVQRPSGEVVFRHQETLTDGRGKAATFRHQTTISLGEMAAGAYLLTVEARNPANAKAVASRQIPFTLR